MTKRPLPGSAHDALDRLFDAIGEAHGAKGAASEGLAVAADFLGVSHWTLRAQLDPEKSGSEISYARVVQLTRQFGCTAGAEHLALCAGGVFIPMPPDNEPAAVLTAEAMQEMAEVVARIFAAVAPASEGGVAITPHEARDALPLVRDVLVAVSNLYSRLSEKAR
ncbi:phage regulatory CII family protein [Ancylobacter pratisalsi]|uniref:Uncharacterized protein n=1 Tax=Ancylobacter pratisalsi TaxID=1745854 RepID=A0A6P1YIY3_9HYPH|nr:phage regulatory CII family protein [Ancylobacter pratisalsi]QIB32656.1 hypothetical protein G3A50_02265 [Ancylobacter pratisalsi]